MNDTTVSILLCTIFICQLASLTIGYKTKTLTASIAYVNAIFAIGVLGFGSVDLLCGNPQLFELLTVVILAIEVVILSCALYVILRFKNTIYVKVINTLGFCFHILATLGMLIFMFTFNLNRLF
ncbi:hypothetical protein [Formosa agariphila]|uniref:hypothetical protein n=1 Tax=Formosa agariphila TaxID=320324 RepID=UPI000571D5E6|nr:hypothetical protein [Formosa agariphila]